MSSQFNHEWGAAPWEEKSFSVSRKYVDVRLRAPGSDLTAEHVYRYSPAYTVNKWSRPQLIIHGNKDYRLPETNGIAVWHALQQCVSSSWLALFGISADATMLWK